MYNQIIANAYGLANSIVQFKKKLIFHQNVIKVLNQDNTYIIHIDCAQSKIKAAIGFMQHIKPETMYQFGGVKLDSSLLKQKAKGKVPSELAKCCCDEIEYANKKELPISDKIEQMLMCMYFKPFYDIKVNNKSLVISSSCPIKLPTKAQINRYTKQFDKIASGKKDSYYKLQGLRCGYMI